MKIFAISNLIYLAFHAASFLFSFISVLGIPGQLDESKPFVKKLTKFLGFVMLAAWYGIPVLFVATLAAFYFEMILVARIFSTISLLIGTSLFGGMIVLYNVKD